MKKSLTVVGIIILVALLGRVGWAYWEVTRSYKTMVSNGAVEIPSKYVGPEDTMDNLKTPTVPTQPHTFSPLTKIFTQLDGIYSASYPSNWVTSGRKSGTEQDQLYVLFTNEGDGSRILDIEIDGDLDALIKRMLSMKMSPSVIQKITIGSNIFTKFTTTGEVAGMVAYALPIQIIEGKTTFLLVTPRFASALYEPEMMSFLKSIKVNSSKTAVVMPSIIEKADNTRLMLLAKAYLSNITERMWRYSKNNNTFAGACDGSNTKTQSVGLKEQFDNILSIVPASNIYCNASVDEYVYSIQLPSNIMCADSNNGFIGVINTKPKTLSCQ